MQCLPPIGMILVLLLQGLIVRPVSAGENYALLVGVGDYDVKELRPLKFTRADVLALHERLLESGFDAKNVVLMHDDLKGLVAHYEKLGRHYKPLQYVTRGDNIRRQLTLLLGRLGRDDSVVVAFSGHGVQFRNEKTSYFCPADASLDRKESLISFGDVFDALKDSRASRRLLLVDACQNDPLTSLAKSRQTVDLESTTRPQDTSVPEGIIALFSCRAGQKSFEMPELGHGVFFHHLLKAWDGSGDLNADGKLSYLELASYTRKQTAEYAAVRLQVLQTPQLKADFSGEWVLRELPVSAGPGSSRYRPGKKPVSIDNQSVSSKTPPVVRTPLSPDSFSRNKTSGPPSAISAAEGLNITNWSTAHLATRYDSQTALSLGALAISADGSKVIYASNHGTFVVDASSAPDKAPVRLSEQQNFQTFDRGEGMVAISADGRRVAWNDTAGLFVANNDGTGKRAMPGGFSIDAMRMSRDGKTLFVVSKSNNGLFAIASDGSDLIRLASTDQVAAVADLNTQGYWSHKFDISSDGKILAFQFHKDIYRMNADGSGLTQITKLADLKRYHGPSFIAVSPKGEFIASYYSTLAKAHADHLLIHDMDGEVVASYNDIHRHGTVRSLRFTPDGSAVAVDSGLRLFRVDGSGWSAPIDTGGQRGPLSGAMYPSFADGGSRIALLVNSSDPRSGRRVPQIAVVDMKPVTIENGLPLQGLNVWPRSLAADGSFSGTATAETLVPGSTTVGLTVLQNGRRDKHYIYRGWLPLRDDGNSGDGKADEGVFGTKSLKLNVDHGQPVASGSLTVRFFVYNEANRMTIVDVGGVEAR